MRKGYDRKVNTIILHFQASNNKNNENKKCLILKFAYRQRSQLLTELEECLIIGKVSNRGTSFLFCK